MGGDSINLCQPVLVFEVVRGERAPNQDPSARHRNISVTIEGPQVLSNRPILCIPGMGGICDQTLINPSLMRETEGCIQTGVYLSEGPVLENESSRNSVGTDIEYLLANPEAGLIPLSVSTSTPLTSKPFSPSSHKNVTI